MMQPTWTPEIYDLIETLTCRVRVLSMKHIHRGWSDVLGPRWTVADVIERLCRVGLIQGDVRKLQVSPVGDEPLCLWSPGQPEPDLERLEQVIQRRWNSEPVPTPIVAASDKACRLFGTSAGGLPPMSHCNHDLLLAEVYLRYRCTQPDLSKNWLGEDAVENAERGVKNPDAFLFDSTGAVTRVIESAGKYSLKQLESFHQHCQSAELPYELW